MLLLNTNACSSSCPLPRLRSLPPSFFHPLLQVMVEEIAQLYVDLREQGYDAPRFEQQRRKVRRKGREKRRQARRGEGNYKDEITSETVA